VRSRVLLSENRSSSSTAEYGKRIDLLVEYCKPLTQLRERLAKGRQDAPRAAALDRKEGGPTLDGKLDDKFWEGRTAYRLSDLKKGGKPAFGTAFRIGWADESLYFGIRCEDRDAKNLAILATKDGDLNILAGDTIELLLETQVHSYYQIVINPAGAMVDFDRKGGLNDLWSSGADVVAHIGENYWSAEIRIPAGIGMADPDNPLKGVAGRRPSSTHPWYFNICRQRVRGNEREFSAFSPTGQADTWHVPAKFGELIVR